MPLPFLAFFLLAADPAPIPAGSANPNCDDALFGKPAGK